MENYNIRYGKGVKWKMINDSCLGTVETSGFTVDNLDTKEIEDAETSYEVIFVTIRKQMEKLHAHCTDVEEERLELCQAIADALHTKKLI